jgi:hypothetical protein
MTEQTSHIAAWFKTWWFLIVFGISIISTLISMWFELQFVVKAVNPDSITEYGIDQARLETKREIRWCLGKLAVAGAAIDRKTVLECAD